MEFSKRNAVNDLLNHSLVITIDDSRYSLFNDIFAYHDMLPLPFKFPGVVDKSNTGLHNCYLAHRNAIMHAKKMNWPFVCIFEDDAYPILNIRVELESLLSEIPRDCLVFHLGYTDFNTKTVLSRNKLFFQPRTSWGTGAYVVDGKVYDEYVRILDIHKEADGMFFSNDENIISKSNLYAPTRNLFCQYNETASMHLAEAGYYLREPNVGWYSKEKLFNMGFPKIQDILEVK